jgi:hypothetical protein
MLRCILIRLALSYNSLRDGCIDDSFSKLSRLRYLNLKGNNLSAFPHAVRVIPCAARTAMQRC